MMNREHPGFDFQRIVDAELADRSTQGPWIPASILKNATAAAAKAPAFPPVKAAAQPRRAVAPLLLPLWMRQK